MAGQADRDRDYGEAVDASARPRDPPTLCPSYGGFESAEALCAKAESGDPVYLQNFWIPAYAGMSGGASLGLADRLQRAPLGCVRSSGPVVRTIFFFAAARRLSVKGWLLRTVKPPSCLPSSPVMRNRSPPSGPASGQACACS